MTKNYNLKNIRRLLTEGFTKEEIRRLCYDVPDFRPVYDQSTQDTSKAEFIDQLVEYVDRKLQFEILLTVVKEYNPARYERHKPYYSATDVVTSSATGKKHPKGKFLQKTIDEELTRKKLHVETFGSDVLGWASMEAESYMRRIGVDAFAIDSCISMYHSFEGMKDGFIRCEFLEEPVTLPFDLQNLVDNLHTLKKNNPKCRLVQYAPPLSDARDYLELTFCLTDYHAFLAINRRLDDEVLPNNMTIRRRYWRDTFDLPKSPIPNMFYVHLLLISGDNKVIVLQRSQFVEEYKGMWSATLEEQMRPKQAGADYDQDVFDTAIRGVREEIGIEVERKDVTFLSLTFEYPNFNVGLAGVVRTQATAREIWQAWQLKYEDREISRFAAIPFEPEVATSFLKERVFNPAAENRHENAAPWHPTARLRLLFGLFYAYGVDAVLGLK